MRGITNLSDFILYINSLFDSWKIEKSDYVFLYNLLVNYLEFSRLESKRLFRLKQIYEKNIRNLKESKTESNIDEIKYFTKKLEELSKLLFWEDNKPFTNDLIYMNSFKKSIFDLPYFHISTLNDDEIDREVLIGFENEKFRI